MKMKRKNASSVLLYIMIPLVPWRRLTHILFLSILLTTAAILSPHQSELTSTAVQATAADPSAAAAERLPLNLNKSFRVPRRWARSSNYKT